MSYIKKFESFNHRIPHTVSDAEWKKKLDTHGKEPFSQTEMDFFQKLNKENGMSLYDMDYKISKGELYDIDLGTPGKSDTIFIQLYPSGEDDSLIEIEITKLKDDWYLIYEPGIDKFICDEWDEVLGYLGSQTNLKF